MTNIQSGSIFVPSASKSVDTKYSLSAFDHLPLLSIKSTIPFRLCRICNSGILFPGRVVGYAITNSNLPVFDDSKLVVPAVGVGVGVTLGAFCHDHGGTVDDMRCSVAASVYHFALWAD
jgi:hypothetical protein